MSPALAVGFEPRLEQYHELRDAIGSERLPCALVLLDAFDRNLERCLATVRASGKTLRPATKSVRVPALIERLLERGGETCQGLMCYSPAEASWWAERGQRDLLVAYPSVQAADLDDLARATDLGARARLVVDCREQLEALAAAGRRHGVTCEAVVELDVSYRPTAALHVGVRRSPLRSPAAVLELCRQATELSGVRVTGLMAYEAHVAGVTDKNPFTRAANPAKRMLKRLAIPRVAELRAQVIDRLQAEGITLDLVNGGGTGSLRTTVLEPAVTEVTAGSAFLAPHLFDYYAGQDWEPAGLFALQVVRASDPQLVTCFGGGYVASGEVGLDRLPLPWLPPGLELTRLEAVGEVQTPLRTRRCPLALELGNPVFFRHAKAGELAERFPEYLLVQEGRVQERVPTYRGLGLSFG